MSSDSQSERRGHHPDGFAEFTEELRLLAEVLLARVEPVLRRTAADGQADLGGCAWCPVCAAAALVRGDHHDVVAALAEHGTSMVTVLREALAGVPVDPVFPPEWAEYAAAHHDSHHAAASAEFVREHAGADPHPAGTAGQHATSAGSRGPATAGGPPAPDSATAGPRGTAPADGPHGSAVPPGAAAGVQPTGAPDGAEHPGAAEPHGSGTAPSTPRPAEGARPGAPEGSEHTRRRSSRHRTGTPRPRRVDEYATPREQPAAPGEDSGIGLTTSGPQRTAEPDRSRTTRAPRSRYVDIPVTIRG
ncbi:hypothetical protein [Nocardia neocaledoniensis]|uniref:hypothetical protein n=1 Tax=Nocardia neocaledoniensis TaxID=236511 RepID=UPI00245759FE|nr:hypothetical protein [Nocardia neocaledoniensis]